MASSEGMASRPNSGPEKGKAQPQEKVYPPHPPNLIFVGNKKPPMSYASFAFLQLTQLDEVVIRARGAAISRAVDVAQIVTKRLGRDLFKVKSVRIGTEVLGEGAEAKNVSTIEIVVGK
jgi:DNA-binding protein